MALKQRLGRPQNVMAWTRSTRFLKDNGLKAINDLFDRSLG
jgi:hypothetical protein